MTAETIDTLRRDMTACAVELADATRRADAAYNAMLQAALPIADAVAIGGAPSESQVTLFRIRRESLGDAYDQADLARARFESVSARFHAALSRDRAEAFADERRLQEGR